MISDPLRFQIDLGSDADDLALHFNPRFHDDADGAVLVCNSKSAGCWGDEKRDIHNPLQRGTDVKVRELHLRKSRCVYFVEGKKNLEGLARIFFFFFLDGSKRFSPKNENI